MRIKKKLQAEIEDGLENLTILNDVTIYDELIEYSGFGIHFDSKKEFDIMFSSSITAVFDSITMLMSRGNHLVVRLKEKQIVKKDETKQGIVSFP